MHPIVHAAVTTAIALAGRRRLGPGAVAFWAGGVLADADHLAWHVQLTRRLDPARAWRHFADEGDGPRPAGTLPLHSWPIIGLAFVAGRRWQPLRWLAAGLAVHRLLDDVDDIAGPWWRGRHTRRKARLHQKVFERAGWQCQSCGAKDVRLHAHHRIQREDGGRDEPENLVALCGPCHRRAHEIPVRQAAPEHSVIVSADLM